MTSNAREKRREECQQHLTEQSANFRLRRPRRRLVTLKELAEQLAQLAQFGKSGSSPHQSFSPVMNDTSGHSSTNLYRFRFFIKKLISLVFDFSSIIGIKLNSISILMTFFSDGDTLNQRGLYCLLKGLNDLFLFLTFRRAFNLPRAPLFTTATHIRRYSI